MKHLSNFLFIWQLSLFILILGNMAKLLTDYLLTKIK
jgi:hypothetical protein